MVVIGCGMIGMGAVAGAVARGAEVIAVDLGDKTAMALKYGAKHAIDAGKDDVVARVNELTGGDGADVVIEAVGLPATFTQAIDLACFAGRVVYIGYSKAPVTYDTKYFNMKELDIHGSRNATIDDFKAVIAYLEGLDHAPDDLISKVFPFKDADKAPALLDRGARLDAEDPDRVLRASIMNTIDASALDGRPRPRARILQWGEGNFLRAFVDWKIDRMNEAGGLDWGVVVVRPIAQGNPHWLNEQDGLYTVLSRGRH